MTEKEQAMDLDYINALPWFDPDAQRRKLAAGTLDVQETAEVAADFRQYVVDGTTRFARDWEAMKGPHGGTGFIEKVASLIHFTAPGGAVCGCNAKRGNPDDKSDDGLALWDDTAPIVDIVTGRRFRFRDVVAGAGGPGASPAWQDLSGTTMSRGLWLQPKRVHDVDTPPPPPPPPPVKPVIVPYAGDEYYIREMGEPMEADYTEGRQTLNGRSAAWFGRVFHDVFIGDHTGRKLTPSESIQKHRNSWRMALGLPPL